MKKLCKFMISVIIMFICMVSCIDKDYDIDDLDKNGMFKVPPVLLGNIDIIWLNLLPEGVPPVSLPVSGMQITKVEHIDGVFSEDVLDKFFNESSVGNVSLESKVDVLVNHAVNFSMDVYPYVLNADGSINNNVKIEKQTLTTGTDQPFSIILKKEYFKYMENANGIQLTIVLKADQITLGDADYVYLKSVVLKSGGIHFEF